ncbi:MAG: RES family NAD+ phosphorylase [Candidatus Hydrogenedentes bacterium]|nr:RES family NAD+ phosphorylase [Candidatus Hydrogenedentota bacterium]
MTPHPRYSALAAKMRKLVSSGTTAARADIVFRYSFRKYATATEMMSGTGAFKAGGRWNAPNTFHGVYCASNPDLANREYFASCRIAGIPEHTRMPLVGIAVEVNLAQVLDLRDPAILKRLGVTQTALNADQWRDEMDAGRESLCQAIGRTAKEAGVEALLVASAQATNSNEHNLVLIIENAPPGSKKWRVMKGHKK